MLTFKIPGMGGEGVVEKATDSAVFNDTSSKSNNGTSNNQNSQSDDSFSNNTHDNLLNNKLADKNSTSKEIISEGKNNVKQIYK